jgi:N-ethylmaleimide reductase
MPFAAFDSMHAVGFDQCQLVRDNFNRVVFAGGGLDRVSGEAGLRSGRFDVAMYGTRYIANPDLVERFASDAAENTVDSETLDTTGPEGYIDYPAMAP